MKARLPACPQLVMSQVALTCWLSRDIPARLVGGPFLGKGGEPPEAVPCQGQGQGEVDRGLGQLEAPVAAGGLVGDGLPDAVAGQAGNEGSGGLPRAEGGPPGRFAPAGGSCR